MTTDVGRRAFMGSTAILGLGAVLPAVARPALAQTPHAAHDGVFDTLGDEIARIVKQMPGTSGPGPLLAMASTFRVFASAVDARRGDERMQIEITRLVNTGGREAVIRRATSLDNADHRRQVLEAAGIPVHDERIPPAVYQQQLDVMLARGGLVPQMTACATAMERTYDLLQGRPSTHGKVVRAQNPFIEQILRCAHLTEQCDHYSGLAAIWCGAAGVLFGPIGLAMAPICGGLSIAAGGYCYAAYHYDC